MAVFSPGFFEADEISHFLKAREMWHDWRIVLDIWGRPACTGLFGLAAPLGLAASRLVAVGVTALIGWGADRLLQEVRRREFIQPIDPAHGAGGYFARNERPWVWVLLYAQPLFLMNTFAVMTELLLACAWVWAAVLLVRGRFGWAGLVIGLGGLARPEGWFAIAAWPWFLFAWQWKGKGAIRWGRLIASSLMAGMPMLAWWGAGVAAYHNPRWMIDFFPWQASSQYGKTGLLFLASAVVSLAIWMWMPVIAAALRLGRERRWPAFMILVGPVGCFYLLHAFLGSFGLMGSMSLPRYFVSVSPFLAILGVIGLAGFERRWRRPRVMRELIVGAVVLPSLVLAAAGQLPVSKTTDMLRLDAAAAAYEAQVPLEGRNAHLIAGHPYVYFRLAIPMDTPAQSRIYSREAMRGAPPGTFIITDAQLWPREGRPTPKELELWGYELDKSAQNRILQVPEHLDLTTLFPAGGQVALWKKIR